MRSKKARRKVAPVVSAVRGKYSSASLQKGHWFLVTREHVIACRTDKATAEFRKLYDQGALEVLVLTDKDIIAGGLDDYVIVRQTQEATGVLRKPPECEGHVDGLPVPAAGREG